MKDELTRDLRQAIRGLTASPVFTMVALVTVALSVGVTSTVFSLVNAVLLRPLPVARPSELVNIYGYAAPSPEFGTVSYEDFLDIREQSSTLNGLVAYTNFFAYVSIERSSELILGEAVSADYFRVLGVAPALGRAFSEDEGRAIGTAPVAVVSHRFWQGPLSGDPEVIGREVRLNGDAYTVIGVAPEGFNGMLPAVTTRLWIPLAMVDGVEPIGNQRGRASTEESLLTQRQRRFLWLKGRMNPETEVPQVSAELDAISTRLSSLHPESNQTERFSAVATSDVAINPAIDRTLASISLVALGTVVLVLAVACANLANMFLARGSARRREMAIRLSLGATRSKLVRHLLLESLTIALAGGLVAIPLSYVLAGLVGRFPLPLPFEIGLDIAPDARVMGFTFLAAAATGIVFGLFPALQASRPELVPALKDAQSRDIDSIRRRLELRDVLVVVQVAVSAMLLVTGGLLVRSLAAAAKVDLGFDGDQVGYLGARMAMAGYSDEEMTAFVETAILRLETMPEVVSVGLASRVPLSLNYNRFSLFIDGHQLSITDAPYGVYGSSVDEGYFDALGLTIVAGRGIEFPDREGDNRIAVVTEALAERHWPGSEAVGQEFRTAREGEPYRIVGVVENYTVNAPGEAPVPYLHVPLPRETTAANFLVRTRDQAGGSMPILGAELRRLHPELTFMETASLREVASQRVFPVRAGALLIGAVGLLASLLAGVGLYGVISYSVSRRIHEIGVRMALGAQRNSVVGLIVGRGMILVASGAVLGSFLAWVGARALSSVLLVSGSDPLSFVGALALLTLVAITAHVAPAIRASHADPNVTLRRS